MLIRVVVVIKKKRRFVCLGVQQGRSAQKEKKNCGERAHVKVDNTMLLLYSNGRSDGRREAIESIS